MAKKKDKTSTPKTDMTEAEKTEEKQTEAPTAEETTAPETKKVAEPPVETDIPDESAEAGDKPAPGLEEQLEAAQQEAAEFEDKWKRAVAELANYKRRQEEQRKLQRDQIKGDVLQGVVSALDDLDLAFQNLPEELDGQLIGWVEGFRLVQRKLDKILEEQNVMPISTDGKFDPNFHEAVSHEDNDGHEEGDIIAELRRGYQIGNRVIRPALVRVAK